MTYNTTEGFEGNWTYSYFSNCTQVESGSHLENRRGWKQLTKEITLEKGKTYYIDIRGYFNINMNSQEGFKVDVIPLVKIATSDFMLSEMAWWSGGANWANSKNITITNIENNYHANEYMRVNVTGLTLATTNCSKELVLIDNSSYQLEMGIINSGTSDGKQWCYVEFLANISANENLNYTAYYNNPNANEQMENLTYFMDDFNRADSTDIGNGWVKPPAQNATDSKILNNELVFIVGLEPAGAFHSVSISSAIPHTIESTGNLTVSKRYAGFYLSDRNTTSAGYTGTYIHWNSGPSTEDSDDYIKLQDQAVANQSANGMTILTNVAYVFYTSINNQDTIGRRISGKVVRQDNGAFFSYHILNNAVTTNTLSIGVLNIQGHADAVGAAMATDYIKVYKGIVYLNSSTYTIGAEQAYDTIPPSITQLIITPQQPKSGEDLECNATLTDNRATTLTAYWKWYKNSQPYSSGSTTVQNGTDSLITTLLAGNTTKGEQWICEVKPFDGVNYGNASNSSAVTILNTAPTHSQPKLQATSKYNTTSDNLTCKNQSTSDADNDKVTNIYNWFKNSQPLAVLNMPSENSAKDYSGKGNNGTIYGATFTEGKIGKALSFDGIDDYVTVGKMQDMESRLNNSFSVSIWVKTANTTTNRRLMGSVDDGSTQAFTIAWNYGSTYEVNNLRVYLRDDEGNDYYSYLPSANPKLTDGAWHHYVFGRNSNTEVFVYIDGEKQTLTSSGTLSTVDKFAGSGFQYPFALGAQNDRGAIASHFNGAIDEAKIYPSALTAQQIKQVYEETKDGKTDNSTIVAQETTAGDTYMCQVTPNDAEEDGVTLNSTSLQILWNITFDVRSGETNVSLPNFNIYCNNSFIIVGAASPISIGFLPANYECTFVATEFYNKTINFVADSDKTINVKMSREFSLTIEEHNMLEEIYNCLKTGECIKLLRAINQTTTQIWQQVTRTNRNVVTQEQFISNTLSNTSNITLNYTIQIPFKQGYTNGELLPLRLFFWFTDTNKTKCYNQDKTTDSNRAESPYCFPLIAETLGPNNGSVTFTIDLRPNLPTASYNVIRAIEIDPIVEGLQRWVNYGQEDVGQVTVEEGNEEAEITLEKIAETLPPKTGFLTGATIQGIRNFLTGNQIVVIVGITAITFLLAIIVICSTIYKIRRIG